ncbi:MAG: hypothetical protein JXN65_03760 [Clostridia bacterium]|nr:hypothetical protein [Clostridia bacterium]
MKITMLGNSSAGKTVYMSRMAQSFYYNNYHGFQLVTKNAEGEYSYLTHQLLTKIDTIESKNKFPAGTDKSTIMNFFLQFNYQKILDIDWIDYKGGSLEEITKEEINEDENLEIESVILASHALMIFIDSVVISENYSTIRKQTLIGERNILEILRKAMQLNKTDLSILFVLTKSDSDLLSEDQTSKLIETAKELYTQLLHEGRKYNWKFSFIKIGCVGKKNIKTTRNISHDNSRYNYEVEIVSPITESYNIEKTLIVCLKDCCEMQLEIEKSNFNSNALRLDELITKNATTFAKLIDLLFGKSQRQLEIEDVKEKMQNEKNQIKNLKAHLPLFERILNGVDHEVELYTIY